jgi:hypothetical protein
MFNTRFDRARCARPRLPLRAPRNRGVLGQVRDASQIVSCIPHEVPDDPLKNTSIL